MPASIATISFTSDSRNVYAAELTQSRGKNILKTMKQADIGPSLQAALVQLAQSAGFKGRKAVLSLSGHEAIVRCFEMPLMPRKEIPSAVRFEAQKYMPFEAKDMRYDYLTFMDLKRRKLLAVFLAARRDLIDKWMQAFAAAGIELLAIEPDILSLLRLIGENKSVKHNEAQALVSARSDGSLDLVVVKDRKPLMARYGVVPPALAQDDTLFGRNFESFAKEIALSFNYFSKTFRNEEIRRIIWFADPGYESQKWAQGLHARFEIPVDEWEGAISPATAVLIGAALRPARNGFPFWSQRIPNLLPSSTDPAKVVAALAWEDEKKILSRTAMQSAAAAAAFIFFIHLLLSPFINSARRNQGALARRPLSELREAKIKLENQMSYFGTTFEDRVSWTEKLNGLAQHTPPEVQLSLLEANEENRGEACRAIKIEGNISAAEPGKELSVANRFVGALTSDVNFMRGFESALLTRVRKVPVEYGAPNTLVTAFAVECSANRKTSP